AATSAANFDTDLMSQEWRKLDASDAAILSAALFLACLVGGSVAGRMAGRAGVSHGFYTFALGAVLLVGAVAGLDQMTRGDALPTAFRTLGIPTAFDEWRDLPALVGLAWALTALVAACLGGAWGERWHTRLVERAADPNVGRGAAARVAAGDRLRGDSGMVDVGERPADAAEVVGGHAPPLAMRLSKPVIAAVNGPAAGVGFVLLCFADIRFAAAGAKLTTSFGRLGLPAEHGVSWLLSRLVGPGRAADLLFSSRVVLAEEAVELGLVNRAFPPDELLPFTLDYARRMAADISPSSLRVMKRQLWDDMTGELAPSVKFAVEIMER